MEYLSCKLEFPNEAIILGNFVPLYFNWAAPYCTKDIKEVGRVIVSTSSAFNGEAVFQVIESILEFPTIKLDVEDKVKLCSVTAVIEHCD